MKHNSLRKKELDAVDDFYEVFRNKGGYCTGNEAKNGNHPFMAEHALLREFLIIAIFNLLGVLTTHFFIGPMIFG